jgi:hypothetical protein
MIWINRVRFAPTQPRLAQPRRNAERRRSVFPISDINR